jgi:hypothetical protein
MLKSLDEKDFIIVQHEHQIKQLKARVVELEPRKRRKVRTSPSSKFTSVKAIYFRPILDLGYSVTFLLFFSATNHKLLIIRLCCARVINSIRVYSGIPSRLLGNPNRTPPQKIYRSLKVPGLALLGIYHVLGTGKRALHLYHQQTHPRYPLL